MFRTVEWFRIALLVPFSPFLPGKDLLDITVVLDNFFPSLEIIDISRKTNKQTLQFLSLIICTKPNPADCFVSVKQGL